MKLGACVTRAVATAALVLAADCSSDYGTPMGPFVPLGCRDNVTLSVSSGTTPTFDWTPGCPVNRVTVDDVNAAPGTTSTVWTLSSSSGVFGPPLQYGVAPSQADGHDGPIALVPGRTYRIIVFYAGPEISYGGGEATFTP